MAENACAKGCGEPVFDSYAASVLRYFLDASKVNLHIKRDVEIGDRTVLHLTPLLVLSMYQSRLKEIIQTRTRHLHYNSRYMRLEEILIDIAHHVVRASGKIARAIWRWGVGDERLAFEGNSYYIWTGQVCCRRKGEYSQKRGKGGRKVHGERQ